MRELTHREREREVGGGGGREGGRVCMVSIDTQFESKKRVFQ